MTKSKKLPDIIFAQYLYCIYTKKKKIGQGCDGVNGKNVAPGVILQGSAHHMGLTMETCVKID